MFASWTTLGLPESTCDLLAGQTLPGVSSLSICFASSHDGGDEEGDGFGFRWEELWTWGYESLDDWKSLEKEEPWRANLAAIWQALAENVNLRRLAIKNLLPVEVSTWERPAWAAFLGRLETLELGLWGNYENRFMREDYHSFQGSLNHHFYRHLTGPSSPLRRFALTAGSVLGSDDMDLAPPFQLSRPEGYMPNLRELRVQDCLVNRDLAVFIAERGRSALRAVELVNCSSRAALVEQVGLEVPFSWADFFRTISETGDRSEIVLERFALVWNWPIDLDGLGDAFGEVYDSRAWRDAKRVRDRLGEAAQRPQDGRRGGGGGACNEALVGFPYVTLFEDGEWSQEGVFNMMRVEGDDAEACRELMGIVRANQERRRATQRPVS